MTYVYLWYLAGFFLEWDILFKSWTENLTTNVMSSNFFFPRKLYGLSGNAEKCGRDRTRHRWQYKATHATCVLDNWGYRHALIIFNTYFSSTATRVSRTGLNVKLPVHFLSCHYCRGPGSSVGIATDYGLDDPGSNLLAAAKVRCNSTDPGPSRPLLPADQPASLIRDYMDFLKRSRWKVYQQGRTRPKQGLVWVPGTWTYSIPRIPDTPHCTWPPPTQLRGKMLYPPPSPKR